MTPFDISLILGLGLLAGVLIGCVGIGGIILVPLLAYLGGVDIKIAIAASMFAYLLSGAVGTFVFARHKSIQWDMTTWMWVGAMPAAFLGALTVDYLPSWALELGVGSLITASGLHAIRGEDTDAGTAPPSVSNGALSGIGAVTGFISALTGTGGPLVLIPILMWRGLPVLMAIGLAQAIQLPIAALATGGNYYAGNLNLLLGCLLGIGVSVGTLVGGKLAHALPRATLRTFVALLMIGVGGLMLANFLSGALS